MTSQIRRTSLGRKVFSGRCSTAVLFLVTAQLGLACDAGPGAEDEGRTLRGATKAAAAQTIPNDLVFGFEAQGAWSTSSGATLAQSPTHSQGSYSLSVQPSKTNGFTPIASINLSTLAAVSPTLAFDLMLPTYQPNPYWFGTAQIYLNCPSRAIYSQFLAQVELTGKPRNVWNTINLPLNTTLVASLLRAGYTDLVITVVLNVQVPTTGIYYIDNLRFVPVASGGCNGLPNGTSCTDASACTVGDTCQANKCQAGPAVVCPPASDQCHAQGTCAPATGLCGNPIKPDGSACDDGNVCTQVDTCQSGVCVGTGTCCEAGFRDVGGVCTDIDECAEGTANCGANATCTNTPGSFTCTCNAGFTGDGIVCTDIDECAAEAAECSTYASCTNTQGGYTCACNAGYSGNGFECICPATSTQCPDGWCGDLMGNDSTHCGWCDSPCAGDKHCESGVCVWNTPQ